LFSLEIDTLARLIVDDARERSLRIVTAESCTGGLVAAALIAVAGASDVFERGFIAYSNRAKQEQLGVSGDMIADLGAVSEPVARMMSEGALENSHAHVSIAVTGVAGPGGGTPMKPVGTVHFATSRANQSVRHRMEHYDLDSRGEIQMAAVLTALEMLRERLR
jgi:nicotinamide-nucleotide amidase